MWKFNSDLSDKIVFIRILSYFMRALTVTIIIFFILSSKSMAQTLSLPQGINKSWIIKEPREVVTYCLFEPNQVKNNLPDYLEFVTIGELAKRGISWTEEYLQTEQDSNLCISFIEILQADTFIIAGKSLDLSKNALGIWFARVKPKKGIKTFGSNLIALKLFVPDSSYVNHMIKNGYFAQYAEVTLLHNDRDYTGFINANNFSVNVSFKTTEKLISNGSFASQSIYFPKHFENKMAIVSFIGHKIYKCKDVNWSCGGILSESNLKIIGETTFQTDYDLVGGISSIK